MVLGSTGTPWTHQARWRRAEGERQGPRQQGRQSGEVVAGREGWEGKWGEAESQAEAEAGAHGPGSTGAPWVEPLGPKSEPPAFTWPSRGRRGPPHGACTQSTGSKLSPLQGPWGDPLQDKGLAGPEGREATGPPWNQAWS